MSKGQRISEWSKFQPYFYPLTAKQQKYGATSVDNKQAQLNTRHRTYTQVDQGKATTNEISNEWKSNTIQDQLPKISFKSPTNISGKAKPKLTLPNKLNLSYAAAKISIKTENSQDTVQNTVVIQKIEQITKIHFCTQQKSVSSILDYNKSNYQSTNIDNQKSSRVQTFQDENLDLDYSEFVVNGSRKNAIVKQLNNFVEKQELTPQEFMKKWEMTSEEYVKYGDRFPRDFTRQKLLGRGGFSIIWLGIHKTSQMQFAIKQLPKSNKHETHLKEIAFGSFFFERGGRVKQKFRNHNGIRNLVRMVDFSQDLYDTWIFYEVCGVSLGTLLYDFASETLKGVKYYKIVPQRLTKLFRDKPVMLYSLLQKMFETIDLVSSNNMVHSDIKSENILVYYDPEKQVSHLNWSIKLIDFGSSFKFTEVYKHFSMATPEYMCPELLTFILKENEMPYNVDVYHYLEKNYTNPWVIDIWGLGCVLLEIISGIPLWMSLDTVVENIKGETKVDRGLFAVKGRIFDKIVQKQLSVASNLDEVLKDHNYSGIEVDQTLKLLLKSMLSIDPQKRSSPKELLEIIEKKIESMQM